MNKEATRREREKRKNAEKQHESMRQQLHDAATGASFRILSGSAIHQHARDGRNEREVSYWEYSNFNYEDGVALLSWSLPEVAGSGKSKAIL